MEMIVRHLQGQSIQDTVTFTGATCCGDSGCHLVRKRKQLGGEGTGLPSAAPSMRQLGNGPSKPVKPSDDHNSLLAS